MSHLTQCNAARAVRGASFPWFDAVIVVAATIIAALVFAYVELTEAIFDSTRAWEHLQIDELLGTLLVLAASLAWFAWRRYAEMRAELAARQVAEQRLESLLRDHRRLTQQHVQLQESERKALARELHDELGQYLNAIKTDAVTIQVKASRSEPLQRAASTIVSHVDHLQETVRTLIGQLRPVGLDVLGLRAALEHYLDVVRERTPQRRLSVALEGELDDLDDDTSLTIYRLIQEGITNVSRHAGAQSVELQVVRKHCELKASDEVRITLSDDGRGADLRANTAGLGLLGMRERIEMLRGDFEVSTAPSKGFMIQARLPVRTRTSSVPSANVGAPVNYRLQQTA
jgi:two-component system sensor histidine kinase UhpB